MLIQQRKQPGAQRLLAPDVLQPLQYRRNVVPRLRVDPDLPDRRLTQMELPSLNFSHRVPASRRFSIQGSKSMISPPIIRHLNDLHHSNSTICTALSISYEFFGRTLTNKHVAEAGVTHTRFNQPPSGGVAVSRLDEATSGKWVAHADGADVAVKLLRRGSQILEGRTLSPNPTMFIGGITTAQPHEQPTEGDGVFLFGFPLGLTGEERNHPIVRFGVIARIQDWIGRSRNTFLIDAPAFPGNSGGSVVLRPERWAVQGTSSISHAILIGVVSTQLRKQEVAISSETRKPRVIFEENTGLAEVVPIELLSETLGSLAEYVKSDQYPE